MLYGILGLGMMAFACFLFYPHWREYMPRVVDNDIIYQDSPKPDITLFLMNTILLLVIVGTAVIISFLTSGLPWMMFTVIGLFGILCFYILMMMFACYTTQYRFNQKALEMRSGFIAQRIVSLENITAVAHVKNIDRVMGWDSRKVRRGFCNRFSNGVSITTSDGVFLLSPSNPKEFLLLLDQTRNETDTN